MKCGRELPLSEFTKNHHSKDGYYNLCKTCKASYETSYRRTVREKARLYDKIVGGGGGALVIYSKTAHAGALFSRVYRDTDLHRDQNDKSRNDK